MLPPDNVQTQNINEKAETALVLHGITPLFGENIKKKQMRVVSTTQLEKLLACREHSTHCSPETVQLDQRYACASTEPPCTSNAASMTHTYNTQTAINYARGTVNQNEHSLQDNIDGTAKKTNGNRGKGMTYPGAVRPQRRKKKTKRLRGHAWQ